MNARARIHAMFNLDETAEQELDARLDALVVEALLKAGVQYVDCPVCGAAQDVGRPCNTCAFKARVAAELTARGKATAPAAPATPDFFEPGHTYTDGTGYTAPEITTVFRVEHVTSHPARGHLRAIGWSRTGEPGAGWHGDFRDEGEFDGWTDITEGGDGR